MLKRIRIWVGVTGSAVTDLRLTQRHSTLLASAALWDMGAGWRAEAALESNSLWKLPCRELDSAWVCL